MDYRKEYEKWLASPALSEDERNELKAIANDEKEIENRFYGPLEFGTAGLRGFFGNIVHKVVHMQHVAAREDARHAGLEAFVDNGAVRHAGERCARAEGELVFRDQTDGQKQRIAGIVLLSAGHRLAVLHAGQRDALDPLLTLDVHDGVAQLQRDAEVIETLDDIALESAGVRLELRDDVHLRAL